MRLNPDEEYVKEIRQKLKESGGYCPCSLIKDEDHKCPCIEFRRDKICHCGLYVND
ncbi:MAG TPA: ferredoxin-thioredoxin reductase catalytic domain-containing protein [Defluviitaleaceae bacterium]|nr:ferredoxin-thioredoxin reductase catalytic domain-containing protein [Defluviitaleaceae bacterium]